MKNPKISIVITLYNLGEYIDDAVNSCLTQEYDNFDIYLVNDGSTEELSKQKVEYYKSLNNPKLHVLDLENQGVVKARNYAAKLSDSIYICFLDADDIYKKDFLLKTVEVFSKSKKNLGFVTSDYLYFGKYDRYIKLPEVSIVEMLVKNSAHTASLILKKAFDEIGGYDKSFTGYMDWDLWLSLIQKNYTWEVLREPIFNYRVREGSMVSKSVQKFNDLYSILVEKHKNLYNQYSTDVILLAQKRYIEIFKELDNKNQFIDEITLKYRDLETLYQRNKKELTRIKEKKAYKLLSKIKHII